MLELMTIRYSNSGVIKSEVYPRNAQEYCASKQEFSTSFLFEKQGTSEGFEWYQIDPKWSRGSIRLVWNQLGIVQNFQRCPVFQRDDLFTET